MSEKSEALGWCVVELMGHRRLGGFVRPVEVAGAPMLRIDVPTAGADESGPWSATQFYSPSAVYCITPTTIEVAKVAAAAGRVEPVSRWELPAAADPARPPAPARPYLDPDRDEDDEDRDGDPPF